MSNPRQTLTLTREQAIEIIDGASEDFELIGGEKITNQDRWTTTFEQIVKRLSDGKFFRIWYSKGSTEYQEADLFDEMNDFFEVFPVQKTITVYE